MSLSAITTRLEPGVHGITFLKACAESEKPLRKVFGFIVINSYNDLMMLKGKKSMAVAFFRDIQHVNESMEGKADIELGICDIPKQILDEMDVKSTNFDDTALITVVLNDAKVSLAARIWLDKDIFHRI